MESATLLVSAGRGVSPPPALDPSNRSPQGPESEAMKKRLAVRRTGHRAPAGLAPAGPRYSAEWLKGRVLLSNYTVTSTADLAPADPNFVGTLRWAVAQANAANAPASNPSGIAFDPGLFASPRTVLLTQGQLELTQGATSITGPGAALLGVSGTSTKRVLQVDAAASAAVSSLGIVNGNAGAGSTLGGGVLNSGTLTLTGCALTEDTAGTGGTVYNQGTLTLTTSTLYGDSASTEGGAVANSGSASVTDCTFTADFAPSGAGVYTTTPITLTADTLARNPASSHGGGIFAAAAVTLNDTLVAGDTGGDLYAFSGGGFTGSFGGAYDLVGDGTGGLAASNHNLLGTVASPLNAKLASPNDYGGPTQTLALMPGSPAVGAGAIFAGPGGAPLSTDQRGVGLSQPQGVDIGAFETAPLAVNTTSDDPVAAGQLSLRDCLNLAGAANAPASAPSAVTFASPLFGTSSQTITLSQGQLELTQGHTTLTGPGADLLAVSANFRSRVLQVDAGATAAASGLTLTQGYTVGASAGGPGGGVLNSGTLTLTGTALTGNTSGTAGGGGAYNGSGGTLTITGSTLSGDFARQSSGGGVLNTSTGTLTISGSTLSGETADGAGGGVYNLGTLTVSDSTLSGGNSNGGLGEGIFNVKTATLNNDIVADNKVLGDLNDGGGQGTFTGSNNLIGNGADQSGLTNGTNGNQVGTASSPIDPRLDLLRNNGGHTQTRALLPGSPAIDKGSNAFLPAGTTTDQRRLHPRGQRHGGHWGV